MLLTDKQRKKMQEIFNNFSMIEQRFFFNNKNPALRNVAAKIHRAFVDYRTALQAYLIARNNRETAPAEQEEDTAADFDTVTQAFEDADFKAATQFFKGYCLSVIETARPNLNTHHNWRDWFNEFVSLISLVIAEFKSLKIETEALTSLNQLEKDLNTIQEEMQNANEYGDSNKFY